MKIKRKNQLLESICLMKESHSFICKATDESERFELMQLCQDMAMQIGNFLDNEIDSCSQIIVELEQYCELIYQASQKQFLSQDLKENIEMCNAVINRVAIFLENVVSENMVAVFLPYNSSMWDALDTVCRSGMKDKEWDIYVMPIPYYSLNTKKKVDQEHFEYNMFSKDLPLVDYRKYSLESLKPDVIFYHNPYDNCNKVTSVHPNYYSTELKKITKNLVYIPYYLSELSTSDYMLALPGIINAWKVMVQTEEIRKQFLKWYDDDKIINLGSPKIEQLLHEVYYPTKLPVDWSEKIKGRKVVFFNMHLKSAMNDFEKYLNLLRFVMKVMTNNTEIVVLWRPHPLMKETIKSFQKELYLMKQYEECIEMFKGLPNSIYDDTSQLHRSMAISNAYVGTQYSSVFRMYKHLKRPMYIMKDIYEGPLLTNKVYPRSATGVMDGENLWQVDYRINALFQTNLVSGTCMYVTTFENNSIWANLSHECIAKHNGWLICTPVSGNTLILYEILNGRTEYVELDNYNCMKKNRWLVDCYEDKILLARVDSSKTYYLVEMNSFKSEKYTLETKDIQIISIQNQEIWTYNQKKKELELIQLKSGQVRRYLIPSKLKCLQSELILYTKQDNLYLVDKEQGILILLLDYLGKYEVEIIELKDGGRKLELAQFLGSTLYFSFVNSTNIYTYNVKNGKLQTVVGSDAKDGNNGYSEGIKEENRIIVMPNTMSNHKSIIEMKSNYEEIVIKEYNIPYITNIKILQEKLDKSDPMGNPIRDEFCELDNFFKTRIGIETNAELEEYIESGKLIWKYIENNSSL